jgi:hypothetical protein
MSIPYGIHGLYGMRKWLESQLNGIPYGLHGMVHGVHGVQVHSIWINPGTVKTSCSLQMAISKPTMLDKEDREMISGYMMAGA